ncbi:hypothetical protein LCGC14_2572290 [marine sediment metagenome]|uniref:PIN domain-containing protein n=1 Tax=marine sediment metagenome TaxID=412755 RepID=A0A0F9B4U6_9ZZZZ
MKNMILLDTDILVDFLRGYSKAVSYVKAHTDRIILSSIVVAELYAGIRDNTELIELDELVSLFTVVPVTPDLAKAGGLYKRDYKKSHGIA